MSQVELSFVIPAYNEESSIENVLGTLDDAVKSRSIPYEIIVVNDGSKDQTFLKAVTYANKNGHVRVVSYTENVGKGFAIKSGFMQTNGEIVVFADSDMDIDLRMISNYVNALKHGDIVVATKWHPDSRIEMPIVRRIMSHGFNVLVRILTGANLKDTQVGLKVLKKSVFADIFPRLCVKRYAFDVELLAVARLYDLKIVEMPTQLRIRESFRLKEVFRMFVDLLGVAYRLKVTRWYQRFAFPQNNLRTYNNQV
ncbi:glycosyltransferase [Candidatus Bathyarchaeota archaeon A05DMB-2]|jgi:glycosyltransferase involved in cell wall biosynthesis|nr:glycosyltransferase [Candidatus Bathyarchaeota archaeon A05DMB-2]